MTSTPGERKPRRDERILHIGAMMSNVMFNLKQWPVGRPLSKSDLDQFAMLQDKWDEAVREYRQSFKRKKVKS
jgi:hypothetical protein